jgi:hypothetical protein
MFAFPAGVWERVMIAFPAGVWEQVIKLLGVADFEDENDFA